MKKEGHFAWRMDESTAKTFFKHKGHNPQGLREGNEGSAGSTPFFFLKMNYSLFKHPPIEDSPEED
jgi:hypothetical protein